MDYIITFLEGIITFISPCLLPLLPVYISYLAGQNAQDDKKRTMINALGFVAGFTVVYTTMGIFAGFIGKNLQQHQTLVNIVTGLIVIVFGLNFMGVFSLKLLNTAKGFQMKQREPKFLSSLLFGLVFSIGWTPCTGVFLGTALMMATQSGGSLTGVLMLFCFSLGLGIPFIISAMLIERLKTTFDVIKRNYRLIHLVCGLFLVAIGLLMATGVLGKYLSWLS